MAVFMKFEDAQDFGINRLEAVKAATASTTSGLGAIATEVTDYSKKSIESSQAFTEKLWQARKPDELLELQSSFAKAAYNDFVARATKIGELYSELTKEAFKALTDDVAKATTPAWKAPASSAGQALDRVSVAHVGRN
jgi:phasin family protein